MTLPQPETIYLRCDDRRWNMRLDDGPEVATIWSAAWTLPQVMLALRSSYAYASIIDLTRQRSQRTGTGNVIATEPIAPPPVSFKPAVSLALVYEQSLPEPPPLVDELPRRRRVIADAAPPARRGAFRLRLRRQR